MAQLPDGPATRRWCRTWRPRAAGRTGISCARLVAAVGADPATPALLIAEGVRVECVRGGWAGQKTRSRGIELRVTNYL